MTPNQYRYVRLEEGLSTRQLVGQVLNREAQRGWELAAIRPGPDGECLVLRRVEGLGAGEAFEVSA